MSRLDWTTARSGDGPAIVRWLEERGDVSGLDETNRKLLCRWKAGCRSSCTVDRILTLYGSHPSELPDEVWADAISRESAA